MAFTCSSEPAGLSAKRKRMKHFSKKQLNSLRRDCRINIGGAFQSWRNLKDSHGFSIFFNHLEIYFNKQCRLCVVRSDAL
uniref:Uncharacterized protein n=1 Tax=Xiphophorus couchianus TaxID=32473 RepID=A0A3B5MWJ1_9TELE